MIAKIKENCHEIPVLGHAEGICHLYVDSEADIDTAIKITIGNISFIYLIGQNFGGQNFRKSDLLPKVLSAEI